MHTQIELQMKATVLIGRTDQQSAAQQKKKKENHPPLMYNCRSKHTVKTHLYTRRHERGSKRKRIESRIKFFVRFKFAVIVCVRFV